MTVTVVLSQPLADEMAAGARHRNESAAVLLAGVAECGDDLRLLGRELIWIPESAYEKRTPTSLTVTSDGYVAALARAEMIGATPIWFHTHPGHRGTSSMPSKFDAVVDQLLNDVFRLRSGASRYASLIFSADGPGAKFSGSVIDDSGAKPIDRLFVVGARWALYSAEDAPSAEEVSDLFSRQVKAFGGQIQGVLSQLSVGIVGCGGTGSAVGEQLARLGVGSLTLADPDVLSLSNVTRVYGSTAADTGRSKVTLLRDHLLRIAPTARVQARQGRVTEEAVARDLRNCDLVFGCTDDNAGRLVLSRLSTYYLIPVIDVGVLVSSTSGSLDGIYGRVTVMSPGEACLVCRGRVDLDRARTEQLQGKELVSLQREGYAPELGGVEPAVVSYTSLVASVAVSELLERFIAYGPEPVPGEVLVRFHEREMSTNRSAPLAGHYCDPSKGVIGTGDQSLFLGQTWNN